MSNSIRESVLAAAWAALKTMSSVPAASVYRSRVVAMAKEEEPSIVLEPLADDPSKPNNQKANWEFAFILFISVRALQNEIPDTLADTIMVEAHAKIMGDATLDALLIDRSPGAVTWQFAEGDETLLRVAQQFKVSYRTNLADITTA